MARIPDSHFDNLKEGPKRLDPAKLKEPPRAGLPWGLLIGVLVVGGLAGGGWYAYRAGLVPGFGSVDLGSGVAGQQQQVAEATEQELMDQPMQAAPIADQAPQPEQPAAAAPVAEAEPVAKPLPAGASPEQIERQIAEIDRGITSLRKQMEPHQALAKQYQAQLADADKKQWPKPGGRFSYEGYLEELYNRAKAAKDGAQAFKIETQLMTYRENRAKTESKLAHENDVIESFLNRITIEETKKYKLNNP